MTNDTPQSNDATPDPAHAGESAAHGGFMNLIARQREKAKNGFNVLKHHLAEESDETKSMLEIYHRSLEGKATREEMKEANEQFLDLIRIAGMGTFFSIVPGSMLLLPLAIAGANKLGIRLLPSSFAHDPHSDSDTQSK
jgi:hypothetical protein